MSFSSSSLVPSFPFCPLLYIQLPFLTASGTAFLDLRGLAISVLLIVLCPALYSCHSQGFEGFVVAVHQCSKGHNVYCPSANSLRLLFCWRDKEKGSRQSFIHFPQWLLFLSPRPVPCWIFVWIPNTVNFMSWSVILCFIPLKAFVLHNTCFQIILIIQKLIFRFFRAGLEQSLF